MSDTDRHLEHLRNIAGATVVAWDDLHGRIPSQTFDRERVSGTGTDRPPGRDREVEDRYLDGQRALWTAYQRARIFGADIVVRGRFDATVPADPVVLIVVCNAIRRVLGRMPDRALDQLGDDLAVANRKFKPWWRAPVQPRRCAVPDCGNLAAVGRTICERDKKRRDRGRKRTRVSGSAAA